MDDNSTNTAPSVNTTQPVNDTTPPQPTMPTYPQTSAEPPTAATTTETMSVIPSTSPTGTDNPTPPPENTIPPKNHKKGGIFFSVFVVILILFLGLGGGLYLVAYDKIDTPLPQATKDTIANFVQSIPFTPKTPQYLVSKSLTAHEMVQSNSFDVSAAVNFSDNENLFGLNNFDFEIKGVSDISDPENVQTSFNMSVTKDFNMDFRKKDKTLYFKINKLPSFLFAFAGIDTTKFDPLLNRWVSYDTTPLDTEARKVLEESNTDNTDTSSYDYSKIFDKKLLSDVKVTQENLDSHAVYKLSFKPDDATLDYLFQKLEKEVYGTGSTDLYLKNTNSLSPQKASEVIKNVIAEMYIDKATYYTRKITLSFDIVNTQKTAQATDAPALGDYSSLFSSSSKASFALVAKLDNFGEPAVIEVPTDNVVTLDEFSQELSSVVSAMYQIPPQSALELTPSPTDTPQTP